MSPSWPVIETDRLRIEPFCEAHLSARYIAWLNDPDVVRFSEQRHRSHTMESCRAFMRSFEGSPNQFWAIVAHVPQLGHIGNISATIDVPNATADIAIMIGEPSARGLGLGTEAFGAVAAYLFRERAMRKVTAGTMADNKPMLKVMETLNMISDGRRSAQLLLDGEPVDVVYAALFAPPEGF